MKTYNAFDLLVCYKEFTVFLNETKEEETIHEGEKYVVTDLELYDDCQFYELYNPERKLYLQLWNDQDHEFVDWHFKKIGKSYVMPKSDKI